MARVVTGAVWDIGACVVVYYGLRLDGADERTALLAATLLAGARLVWVAWRRRRVTWFAAVMLAVFGTGLLWTLLEDDVRVLLLKDSAVGVGLAAIFLLSLASGRPLTLSAAQTSRPDKADALEALYRERPDVRRRIAVSAVVWAAGLLLASAVRIPLVSMLPVDVMVGLNEVLTWGTIGLLVLWNLVYTLPMWREIDGRPAGTGRRWKQ